MNKALGVDIGGVIYDLAINFKPSGDVTEEEILAAPVIKDSIESPYRI